MINELLVSLRLDLSRHDDDGSQEGDAEEMEEGEAEDVQMPTKQQQKKFSTMLNFLTSFHSAKLCVLQTITKLISSLASVGIVAPAAIEIAPAAKRAKKPTSLVVDKRTLA